MYTLNGRQVEITETEHDDGVIFVIAANFTDGDMGVEELNPDQLYKLEEKYQDDLRADWYSGQIDHAQDMMEDR